MIAGLVHLPWVVVGAALTQAGPGVVPGESPSPKGAPVDAVFIAADGKAVKLSEYRGKQGVVLLFMRGFKGEFSCYYCSQQSLGYKKSYDKIKAAGLEVLVVLPGATDAKGFLKKAGENFDPADESFTVPFPVVLDNDFSACRVFGVPIVEDKEAQFPVDKPATVLISKSGAILYSYHGEKPGDRPSAEQILEVVRTGVTKAPGKEAPRPEVASLPWMTYEEGMKEAAAKNKPILLDFYAEW